MRLLLSSPVVCVLGLLTSLSSGQVILHQSAAQGPWSNRVFTRCGDTNDDGVEDYFLYEGLNTSPTIRSGLDGSVLLTLPTVMRTAEKVWPAGDVNGDGRGDIVLEDATHTIVYSGHDATVLLQRPLPAGAQPGDVASLGVGDVDADGLDDLAIWDTPLPTSVTIVSGATGSTIWTLTGPPGTVWYGMDAQPAGDIDGDGHDDILVLSTCCTGPGPATGVVHVVSGATGLDLYTYSFGAPAANTIRLDWGDTLVGGEDVDGDGVPDFAVGSPSSSGTVHVVSGANGQLLRAINGAYIGVSLNLGDMNNDGLADLTYGWSYFANVTFDLTVVSAVSGEVLATTAALPFEVTGGQITGDLDGDGFRDFIVRRADTFAASLNQVSAISFGASLGATASGNVMGGAFRPLRIDQWSGGGLRRVDVDLGTPFNLEVRQPPSNPVPAHFAIFGRVGIPTSSETITLAGVGDMCLIPEPLAPWGYPVFFTAVTSVSTLSALVQSSPAPWNMTVPGIGVPLNVTLQGVIMESVGVPRVTNGVILSIR